MSRRQSRLPHYSIYCNNCANRKEVTVYMPPIPFYCPFCASNMRVPQQGYIRFLNAVTNIRSVDILVNDVLRVRNLLYQGFSTYLALPRGGYNIKIYPAGRRDNLLLNTNLNLLQHTILTESIIGSAPNVSLFAVPEPRINIKPYEVYLRFVSLSPNAPNMDLTLPNGRKLFTNVSYKEITRYIPITPGRYTLQIRETGTNRILLTAPRIHLRPGRIHTVYAVGLLGESPPLQVLIPLDGNSYINPYRE